MTLTDKERKAKQKKYIKTYNQKPENKARLKARTSTPENKAKQKEYDKKYHQKPENKAKRRVYASSHKPRKKEYDTAYNQRPEVKARKKIWSRTPERKARIKARNLTPEAIAWRKEYNQRPERKAKQKEYDSRPKRKAKRKEYGSSPKRKAYIKKYQQLPKYKAGQKEHADNIRLKILQTYSKRLSNSDIPCCNCCGEKSHIGFLAIDHKAGKKQMDSEPKLVELGYSSSMVKTVLTNWIIKNNFPDGFQILCHNCNQAKAIYGKCPHEK